MTMNNDTIKNEMEAKQIAMYGLTAKAMVENYLQWNAEGDVVSMQMWAMGMLSDIQERMAMGLETEPEELRQALNRAKYWMSEVSRIVRVKERNQRNDLTLVAAEICDLVTNNSTIYPIEKQDGMKQPFVIGVDSDKFTEVQKGIREKIESVR